MRTQEQITAIKNTQSDPKQHWDILNYGNIIDLLIHYNDSSKKVEQKSTGPKVLYVKEGEGVIDNILDKLRQTYGDFEVRSAHYFDVTKPHIIHNDDDFDYPQCYKAFVIPLLVEGATCDKAKFFVFDQSYYGGPAKFVNGEDVTGKPVHYNTFLTDYTDVQDQASCGLNDFELQHLTHLKPKWLKGLSVNKYFDWRIGSIISFDSLDLHCSSDFNAVGITRKIGLSIFTRKNNATV